MDYGSNWMNFGSIWDYFGSILVSYGSTLEAIWYHFGLLTCAPCVSSYARRWRTDGITCDQHFGSSCEHFSTILVSFWSILVSFWDHLWALSRILVSFGIWEHFGIIWDHFGRDFTYMVILSTYHQGNQWTLHRTRRQYKELIDTSACWKASHWPRTVNDCTSTEIWRTRDTEPCTDLR